MLKSRCTKFLPAATMALLLSNACLVAAAHADSATQATERLSRIATYNHQIAELNAVPAHSQTSAAGSMSQQKDLVANVRRSYPPSCLSDGLPFNSLVAGDPLVSGTVRLLGDPVACLGTPTAECSYTENVYVSVWRVACSSGTSATVMEIDRAAGMNGNRTLYPTMPGVTVQQGSSTFAARLAEDPNTTFTMVQANSPIFESTIFALENFYSGLATINYNQAFTLTLDNFSGGASRYTNFTFPAYNPASYTYGYQPLPITGYVSGNWYDPAHSGEGMFVTVLEIPGDASHRAFTFAWFTYDPIGIPYWLFGSALVDTTGPGSRLVTVPTGYYSNGGFAGAFGSAATGTLWGHVEFEFTDCGHMHFAYNGNTGTFSGPSGTGVRTWSRLLNYNINSLTCE